jgi:antitoxin (DNA-binding transcriptional repressor) of toxin-antitoxin stability system
VFEGTDFRMPLHVRLPGKDEDLQWFGQGWQCDGEQRAEQDMFHRDTHGSGVAVIDKCRTGTENVHMKTATVRDLRNNFAMIEAWLRDGVEVCIEKRGEPVAMLTALKRSRSPAKIKNPDFAARQKAIWGDRVFSEQEVKEMREYELEGEEG